MVSCFCELQCYYVGRGIFKKKKEYQYLSHLNHNPWSAQETFLSCCFLKPCRQYGRLKQNISWNIMCFEMLIIHHPRLVTIGMYHITHNHSFSLYIVFIYFYHTILALHSVCKIPHINSPFRSDWSTIFTTLLQLSQGRDEFLDTTSTLITIHLRQTPSALSLVNDLNLTH